MSVESNWIWVSRGFTIEQNVSESETLTRKIYTLVRKKIYDGTFTHELNSTKTSVSAYTALGLETESVGVTLAHVHCKTATNYTTTVSAYYKTGYEANGEPTFAALSDDPNIPDGAKRNAIFLDRQSGAPVSTYAYQWTIAEFTQAEVDSGAFTTASFSNFARAYSRIFSHSIDEYEVEFGDNSFMAPTGGTFSSTKTVAELTEEDSGEFLCTAEDISVEDGKTWRIATQTWQYKSAWA